jgi:hypothetical protein
MRRKGSKLGEPCPKARLSQDRLANRAIFPHVKRYGGGESNQGEGDRQQARWKVARWWKPPCRLAPNRLARGEAELSRGGQ